MEYTAKIYAMKYYDAKTQTENHIQNIKKLIHIFANVLSNSLSISKTCKIMGLMIIWNPDHLARIGQNGTYTSAHGTYMFILCTSKLCRRVCTMYIHIVTFMNVYVHVHECIKMYVLCTYMVLNVYISMYIVQSRLYSFTTSSLCLRCFPPPLHPWHVQPACQSSPAAYHTTYIPTNTCLDWFSLYHVHILHIQVHSVYICSDVHTLYKGATDCLHIPLQYMPACTPLVLWMYYAIIQESAVWYRQVSESLLKYSYARCQLSCNVFTFSCTDIIQHSFSMYRHWQTVFIHVFEEKLEESGHLA